MVAGPDGGWLKGAVRTDDVRAPVAAVLDEMFPGWRDRDTAARADYIEARRICLERLIARDRGGTGDLERSVAHAVASDTLLDIGAEADIEGRRHWAEGRRTGSPAGAEAGPSS